MEDESFELLSSLSPRVRDCQKHFRKGTTVLALRESLRKSSIYDKSIRTKKNHKSVITEISSTTTTATSASKSSNSHANLANGSPISIHDSDSENEVILIPKKSKPPRIIKQNDKTSTSKLSKVSLLSQDKFENIKQWIDSVNVQSGTNDISSYSEFSTIYGEEKGTNFITERTGRAVNSTVIGSTSIHFQDLFKRNTDRVPSKPKEDFEDEPNETDESCVERNRSLDKKTKGNFKNTIYRLDDIDFISNSNKSLISSSSKGKSEKISGRNSGFCKSLKNADKINLKKDLVSESDKDIINDRVPSKSKEDFENEPDEIDESYVEKNSSLDKKAKDNFKNTIYKLNDIDFISNSTKSVISSSSKGKSEKISGSNSDFCNRIKNSDKNNLKKDLISKSDEDIVNDSENSFSLNESLNTRLKNKSKANINVENNISHKISNGSTCPENNVSSGEKHNKGTENVNVDELASMLDDLYGNKWREKSEHVLPKSEPRKRIPNPNSAYVTKTERKPKLSVLYKNPYLETEKSRSANLLQTLQKSRLKNYIESPLMQRLNDLCDSDTNSDVSDDKTSPRKKLDFDDSDCDEHVGKTPKNNEKTTSKYFRNIARTNKKTVSTEEESNKENRDDFSFFGESLEERIRKKINGVKDVRGDRKKEKKDPREKTTSTNGRGVRITKSDEKTNKVTKKTEEKSDDNNRKLSTASTSSSDDTWEAEISKIVHDSKPVNGKYSFLASLSANVPILECDMSARIYRNNFKTHKDQLLAKLFKMYNEKVFENAIPHDTKLEWNDRMRGTAGFCYCKKITRKTGSVERTARIVLATKVIDAAYRLRDTLIHEMCHAATWIVNCVSDGHGTYWKSWAFKAMKTFPELPPIKRCHDYVINTKYTYKCTGCGYSIGRHSKSLDIERKRCGYCLGKFEVLLNKVDKKGETKSVPATPKKELTGFALFVKENYSVYRQTMSKHGDVMKLLGQKFQELKVKTN